MILDSCKSKCPGSFLNDFIVLMFSPLTKFGFQWDVAGSLQ